MSEQKENRKKELEKMILEYTEELADDINLRLLAQQEIGPAGFRRGRYHTGEVLYVESIIVTDIRYPQRKQERKRPIRTGKPSGQEEKQKNGKLKNILKRR